MGFTKYFYKEVIHLTVALTEIYMPNTWQLHWFDRLYRGSHNCDSYIDNIVYTEGVIIVTATLIRSYIQRESSLWQLHWLDRIYRGSHHCDNYIDYILYTESHHSDSYIDLIVYTEGVIIVTATLIWSYTQRESSLWQLHWFDHIYKGSLHCDSYIDLIV